jgi:Xaa-Pro aminopeptidase
VTSVAGAELRARRLRVARDLAARGLAGAVVSDPANVRYLGGFALEQPWWSRTRPTLCVLAGDGRLAVVASAAVSLDEPPVDAIWRYEQPAAAPERVAAALADAGLAGDPVGAELGGEHRLGLGLDELGAIERLHGRPFGDAGPSLWAARIVKSPAEIALVREASAVGDRVYARLFGGELRAGASERAIARRVRRLMLEEGADEPGWVMLTAGRGAYGRLLSTPRERPVERGELVWLDIACRVGGYWSDHSRAGVLGVVSDAHAAEQARVVEATVRGVARVAPGVALADVAGAAALPGESTPGRVGHGLGLGSTEPPDVVAGSDVVLEPGHVFTIEPLAVRERGIYQAETVVAVTADGCEVLTTAPMEIAAVPG